MALLKGTFLRGSISPRVPLILTPKVVLELVALCPWTSSMDAGSLMKPLGQQSLTLLGWEKGFEVEGCLAGLWSVPAGCESPGCKRV